MIYNRKMWETTTAIGVAEQDMFLLLYTIGQKEISKPLQMLYQIKR